TLTGLWRTEAYVESGPARGNSYGGWITFYQTGSELHGNFASAYFSGTCSGSYASGTVRLSCSTTEGYQASITASVSGDHRQIQGSWSDNHGNSGTYTAWRYTSPPYTGKNAFPNVEKVDPSLRGGSL
ncbi:hypothetical protein, partial [Ammonifex thiophilus]